MKNKKIVVEDGEGGGDAGIGDVGDGMGSVDILGGGSDLPNELGVLGLGNFQFPVKLGKIKKRLLDEYALLRK